MNVENGTSAPTRIITSEGFEKCFAGKGEEISLKQGAFAARAGEVPLHCYMVKKGRIVGRETTYFGEERIYNIMDEGAMFLEPHLLFSYPTPVDFVAASDSVLLKIDRETLISAMENGLGMKIYEMLSYKFFAAMDGIRETNIHTVQWKILNLLSAFGAKYGEPFGGGVIVKERLTQKTLAGMLGVNRVTMARSVKELKEDGTISLHDSYYVIPRGAELERILTEIDEKAYGKSRL